MIARMKALALAALAMSTAATLHATTTSSFTLSCTDVGGNPVLSSPITGAHVDTSSTFAFFFSVSLPISQYNYMLYQEYFGSGPLYCQTTPGYGDQFENATLTDVQADVNSSEQTATATFTFTNLSLGPESAKVSPKLAPTAEQKENALQHYLDRLPLVMKAK